MSESRIFDKFKRGRKSHDSVPLFPGLFLFLCIIFLVSPGYLFFWPCLRRIKKHKHNNSIQATKPASRGSGLQQQTKKERKRDFVMLNYTKKEHEKYIHRKKINVREKERTFMR